MKRLLIVSAWHLAIVLSLTFDAAVVATVWQAYQR